MGETTVLLTRDVPQVESVEQWLAYDDSGHTQTILAEVVAKKYEVYNAWLKTGLAPEQAILAQNMHTMWVIDTAVLMENQRLFNEMWPTHPWFARLSLPTILTMCRNSTLNSIVSTWAMIRPTSYGSFWQDFDGKLTITEPVQSQVIPYNHVWHIPVPQDVRKPFTVENDAEIAAQTAFAIIDRQVCMIMEVIKKDPGFHFSGDFATTLPLACKAIQGKVGGLPTWACGKQTTLDGLTQMPGVSLVPCPVADENELFVGYRGSYTYESGICLHQYVPLVPANQTKGVDISIPVYGRFAITVRPDVGKYYFAHLTR